MPSSNYRITEPHPSVPSSRYLYAGRGGAGNISHIDPSTITSGTSASGPASRANLSSGSNSARNYTAGRGGAGNLQHTSERPIFSFDEELERQQRMIEHQAPVYHIGRGGAGNYAASETSRRGSSGSSSSEKSNVERNSSEGTWQRFRSSFSSK